MKIYVLLILSLILYSCTKLNPNESLEKSKSNGTNYIHINSQLNLTFSESGHNTYTIGKSNNLLVLEKDADAKLFKSVIIHKNTLLNLGKKFNYSNIYYTISLNNGEILVDSSDVNNLFVTFELDEYNLFINENTNSRSIFKLKRSENPKLELIKGNVILKIDNGSEYNRIGYRLIEKGYYYLDKIAENETAQPFSLY